MILMLLLGLMLFIIIHYRLRFSFDYFEGFDDFIGFDDLTVSLHLMIIICLISLCCIYTIILYMMP